MKNGLKVTVLTVSKKKTDAEQTYFLRHGVYYRAMSLEANIQRRWWF
ncbi:hypothetical protein [Arenibacter sp. F20364]|nr:hypothetical protein [Arenibacter sp. F20364]MCK0192027.1 hypothetical protein [Arenibacter sp. F20364]